MLLYQCEHGKMPDENWTEQIAPHLAGTPSEDEESGVPAKWFSCPSCPSPEGQTTYALVQYDSALPVDPDTILLVELKEPVPFSEAIISADEVLERKRTGKRHHEGMNAAYRNGAVRFLHDDDAVQF